MRELGVLPSQISNRDHPRCFDGMQLQVVEVEGEDQRAQTVDIQCRSGIELAQACGEAFDRYPYEIVRLFVDGERVDTTSNEEQISWSGDSMVRVSFISTIEDIEALAKQPLSEVPFVIASSTAASSLCTVLQRIQDADEAFKWIELSGSGNGADRGWTEIASAIKGAVARSGGARNILDTVSRTGVLIYGLNILDRRSDRALSVADKRSEEFLKWLFASNRVLELHADRAVILPAAGQPRQ